MYDQTYYTTTTSTNPDMLAGFMAFLGLFTLVGIAAYVLMSLGLMQYFKKAGKPGWAGFVPFYNIWIMREISGVQQYWFWIYIAGVVASVIPVLNFVAWIASLLGLIFITIGFLKKYGKGGGHVVLALLFGYIYYPVTGYSKNLMYSGVVDAQTTNTPPTPPSMTPPTTPTV